jgi:hypothetical protein
VIIIEGPDGGGKSTLVQLLSERLKLPVADKVVASDTTAMVDLVKWTEENVEKGFQRTIFDRHRLISEPIYGPILKPRQDPSFGDLAWMSDMVWRFYQAKPIVIYCLPDIHTVRANVLREDTDNSVVQNRIAAIYVSYVNRAALDFTRGVGRLYNYKTTRLDDIVGWVNLKLMERAPDDRAVFFPRQADSEAVDRGRNEAASRAPH